MWPCAPRWPVLVLKVEGLAPTEVLVLEPSQSWLQAEVNSGSLPGALLTGVDENECFLLMYLQGNLLPHLAELWALWVRQGRM